MNIAHVLALVGLAGATVLKDSTMAKFRRLAKEITTGTSSKDTLNALLAMNTLKEQDQAGLTGGADVPPPMETAARPMFEEEYRRKMMEAAPAMFEKKYRGKPMMDAAPAMAFEKKYRGKTMMEWPRFAKRNAKRNAEENLDFVEKDANRFTKRNARRNAEENLDFVETSSKDAFNALFKEQDQAGLTGGADVPPPMETAARPMFEEEYRGKWRKMMEAARPMFEERAKPMVEEYRGKMMEAARPMVFEERAKPMVEEYRGKMMEGGMTVPVYTPEQQARLGVAEDGRPILPNRRLAIVDGPKGNVFLKKMGKKHKHMPRKMVHTGKKRPAKTEHKHMPRKMGKTGKKRPAKTE